jgi:hypothetical protein
VPKLRWRIGRQSYGDRSCGPEPSQEGLGKKESSSTIGNRGFTRIEVCHAGITEPLNLTQSWGKVTVLCRGRAGREGPVDLGRNIDQGFHWMNLKSRFGSKVGC